MYTCQEELDSSTPDVYQESIDGAWNLKKEYIVNLLLKKL